MIEAEIRVNGAIVAHAYAKNITSYVRKEWEEPDVYKCSIWEPEGRNWEGIVEHYRKNGWEELFALIFRAKREDEKEGTD